RHFFELHFDYVRGASATPFVRKG
ncbi:MAG: hypothetical protein RL685_592, partial [Pseudomonadota bacterium]